MLGAALPAAAGAQEASRRCQLNLDHADRGFADGNNYFASGDVRISCKDGSVRMRSDSLASYASQIVHFVGNVRYEDSTMTMDAERGTYVRASERWEARGNVVTRNLRNGSTLKGPSLDYYHGRQARRSTT
jgi:lipopolysaccharide assembly outer membrane protein LptD (OstA)